MKAISFRVTQMAFEPDGRSRHAMRNWLILLGDEGTLRAEVRQSTVFAGHHANPPYAKDKDEDYLCYLLILNGDHFWFKRYKSDLAPQWIYHHLLSSYVPYTDFYFTVNDSDLFYRYCASNRLLAQQVSSLKPKKAAAFHLQLQRPVLCPYPHVTHHVRGRWSGTATVPAAVEGLDYHGRQVWQTKLQQADSRGLPKQMVTIVKEGFLHQRVMQGYGTPPGKPENFFYFVTRSQLRLPARRVVKTYTQWQGKPLLHMVEGWEENRFTRLEFSGYTLKEVSKELFRLEEKPNRDDAQEARARFKTVRPPYEEPPPEAFLKDPGEREGLQRVRDDPETQTYHAVFDHFQFEQTFVLALMENVLLWQHGYALLP